MIASRRPEVLGCVVAGGVVGCGQQRRPHLTEPGRNPFAERLDLTRRGPQPLTLLDQELFELIDVADQELAASDERLNLVLGRHPLGVGRLAGLDPGFVEQG